MNRIVLVVGIVVIIAVGILTAHYILMGYLPPRTPHKVARAVSDLPVPSSARVVEFEESWSLFQGDGVLRLVLDLDEYEFGRLRVAALDKDYQLTNSAVLRHHGFSGHGLIYTKSDPGYTKAIYLDVTANRLCIRIINL